MPLRPSQRPPRRPRPRQDNRPSNGPRRPGPRREANRPFPHPPRLQNLRRRPPGLLRRRRLKPRPSRLPRRPAPPRPPCRRLGRPVRNLRRDPNPPALPLRPARSKARPWRRSDRLRRLPHQALSICLRAGRFRAPLRQKRRLCGQTGRRSLERPPAPPRHSSPREPKARALHRPTSRRLFRPPSPLPADPALPQWSHELRTGRSQAPLPTRRSPRIVYRPHRDSTRKDNVRRRRLRTLREADPGFGLRWRWCWASCSRWRGPQS